MTKLKGLGDKYRGLCQSKAAIFVWKTEKKHETP
jgi:hypothetical protein